MDSAAWQRWDRELVWHPFSPMSEYRESSPPIIDSAEGFFLIDVDGRRYLDGVSSLWCNVHGHRVPELDQALRAQLDKVAHSTLLGLGSTPSIELAQRLIDLSPVGLEHVFYSDSGSTAVEVALKMAYQFHRQKPSGPEERDTFFRMSLAYHGDTVGSVSVGGIPLFHQVYDRLLFRTIEIPTPGGYQPGAGTSQDAHTEFCLAELQRLLQENHHRAAAFVIEPLVQGAAGILVHPPGYLRRVRELTREYGVLLIADEVATGFGRTGSMWACQQEQVVPDLMCLAKGITGGYLPLAATLASTEIFQAFLGRPEAGRTFFHGHTYTGNPLACAVANASIQLMQANSVVENAAANSEVLRERLRELDGHPHVAEVRQCGLMVGIELVRDRERGERFNSQLRIGHRVTVEARKLGLITRPLGDVIILMPAPAMPRETLDQLCDLTFAAIDAGLQGTASAAPLS